MVDDYILDDSEYEVLETGDPEPITSEEVKRKLESPLARPIEQEDFDRKDYTILDYLKLEEGQYPRNLSDNKGSVIATGMGTGLVYGGSQLFSQEPMSGSTAVAGFIAASYISGLIGQDMDVYTAVETP